MKRLGRLTFTRLSAASFVLCIAIAVLCLQSFQGGWRLHFRTSDARCMLKSSDGMLVIEGPPSGQRDDVTRGIASRMSNKDFQWGPTTPQAGGLYLKGEVVIVAQENAPQFCRSLKDVRIVGPVHSIFERRQAIDAPRA